MPAKAGARSQAVLVVLAVNSCNLKLEGDQTYRHPVPLHIGDLLLVIDEPAFWLELINIITIDGGIPVLYPAVDSKSGLAFHISTLEDS